MKRKPLFSERELAEAQDATLASHDHIRRALENCSDGPDQFFNACVDHAQDGDNWAAREVLHSFCTCFENGWPVPHRIQQYMYLAFSKYLSHGSTAPLENALGLVAPAHRKKGALNRKGKERNDVPPLQLVANVYVLIKRDGLKKGAALEKTAEQFRVSKRAIEGYDREWNLIREYPLDDLLRLAQPVAESLFRN